jgi:hypothetical protein
MDERIKALEQWRRIREEERDRLRRDWSDSDLDDLRLMLTGWVAAAAVKAFWRSAAGRAVILGAAGLQLATFGLALLTALHIL